MRASVFIATSLDGFIARPDGALDWLPGANGTPMPEDHGYDAFIATVDVLVLGRSSFETVLGMGVGWPYGEMAVRVLTTRPIDLPESLPSSVRVMAGAPKDLMAELEREGFRHAYIDGGKTIQGFLAAGQIQKLIVTRIPVLLGAGIPLFGAVPRDIALRHVRTYSTRDGLVQSEYEVVA